MSNRSLHHNATVIGAPCAAGHTERYANGGHCVVCCRERAKVWYIQNRDRAAANNRKFHASNPDANYKAHLKRAYGIPLGVYQCMLSDQNGRCAICGSDNAKSQKGRWHLDHCHATNRLRGILCQPCNHMLGNSGDSPERLLAAIDYLVAGRRVPSLVDSLLSFGG